MATYEAIPRRTKVVQRSRFLFPHLSVTEVDKWLDSQLLRLISLTEAVEQLANWTSLTGIYLVGDTTPACGVQQDYLIFPDPGLLIRADLYASAGMMHCLEDDRQLTAILAHEIGHCVLGHTGISKQQESFLAQGRSYYLLTTALHQAEYEADVFAARLMSDPQPLADALTACTRTWPAYREDTPTHPNTISRVQRLLADTETAEGF